MLTERQRTLAEYDPDDLDWPWSEIRLLANLSTRL